MLNDVTIDTKFNISVLYNHIFIMKDHMLIFLHKALICYQLTFDLESQNLY